MSSEIPMSLNSNTLSSLVLHNAVFKDGHPISLVFSRTSVPLDLVKPTNVPCECASIPCTCNSDCVLPNGPPARRTVHRPPSPTKEVNLQFTLDQFINFGASGSIYSTKSTSISSSAYYLGPFVVKIANRNYNKSLFREAWFYDELQKLQGATIPRCYGYFEAELPEGCTFTPWKTVEHMLPEVHNLKEEPSDNTYDDFGAFNELYRTKLSQFETAPLITLLLLEPLGGPFLHIGSGKPFPDEMRSQLRAAYHDIGCLAVEHGDVRRNNILEIADNTGPSLPSPFSGQHYPFRIVDFGRSQKNNAVPALLDNTHDTDLQHMYDTLPYHVGIPGHDL
ncbi:hypothetical protein Hypma_007439 [Hypsizygus marmoreus]|uniref:Protein kinase domain-containing protein n=1 Tax=Hypsizygus marmoreus TaxID=39966 RepID=A0A369JW45_HYPMA|nr:hypothetical protein Hypma_007439 [Hypsizygus marmoreus]